MAGSIIRPDESSVSLTKLADAAMPMLILLLESPTQCGAHLALDNTVKILSETLLETGLLKMICTNL